MHVGAGRGGYGTTLFDGWMRIQQLLSVMAYSLLLLLLCLCLLGVFCVSGACRWGGGDLLPHREREGRCEILPLAVSLCSSGQAVP